MLFLLLYIKEKMSIKSDMEQGSVHDMTLDSNTRVIIWAVNQSIYYCVLIFFTYTGCKKNIRLHFAVTIVKSGSVYLCESKFGSKSSTEHLESRLRVALSIAIIVILAFITSTYFCFSLVCCILRRIYKTLTLWSHGVVCGSRKIPIKKEFIS